MSEYDFSMFTNNEIEVLKLWAKDPELSLSALSHALLSKLYELTQPSPLYTRIENFNFTKFDGEITKNHLVNIVLLSFVYSETRRIGDDKERKRVVKLMHQHYKDFFDYFIKTVIK